MTPKDKKLLELAAKAAGIDIEFRHGDFYIRDEYDIECQWHPLSNNWDAFDLMVRLDVELQKEKDPHAAARRRVVMAAAELAKEKK